MKDENIYPKCVMIVLELFQRTPKILWKPDFPSTVKPSYNGEFDGLTLSPRAASQLSVVHIIFPFNRSVEIRPGKEKFL